MRSDGELSMKSFSYRKQISFVDRFNDTLVLCAVIVKVNIIKMNTR
jgi:hypothetical protein